MRRIVFVTLLWLLLPACNQDAVRYSTYDSEALGISFEYPEAWALEANELEVNVATDESLFAANAAAFNSGAVVNFSSVPLEAIGGDMATALTQFVNFISANEEAEQVGEMETMVINNHTAVQATVNLGESRTMIVTMIGGNEEAVLIAAVYDEAQYADMLAHVIESVTFAE